MKKPFYIVALMVCWSGAGVRAGSDVWTGGGSYDGYEGLSDRGAMGYPQVNNARGATGVTASNAVLNGVLIYTGSAPASVTLYWGVTDGRAAMGDWGHTNPLGGGSNGQVFALPVVVDPGTTYYYRFSASNSVGEMGWASSSARFVTPAPPGVTAGVGVAPVSYTTAGLNGELTAGLTAAISVCWGLNTNAWANTNALGVRGQGVFQIQVSGLSVGTVYYYQCIATNLYGSNASTVVGFTTRVPGVFFEGGSYDGYAREEDLIEMQLRPGSALMVIF